MAHDVLGGLRTISGIIEPNPAASPAHFRRGEEPGAAKLADAASHLLRAEPRFLSGLMGEREDFGEP